MNLTQTVIFITSCILFFNQNFGKCMLENAPATLIIHYESKKVAKS